jgi:hypothetical protein
MGSSGRDGILQVNAQKAGVNLGHTDLCLIQQNSRRVRMRYMLLIYQREGEGTPSPEESEQSIAAHWAVIEETRKLGILRGCEPLHPTSTATTIRMQEGKKVVVDGPFAETKEQLAGYYILDCTNLDEAINWASKLPLKCSGGTGCIEIRPIGTLPERSTPASAACETSVHG